LRSHAVDDDDRVSCEGILAAQLLIKLKMKVLITLQNEDNHPRDAAFKLPN